MDYFNNINILKAKEINDKNILIDSILDSYFNTSKYLENEPIVDAYLNELIHIYGQYLYRYRKWNKNTLDEIKNEYLYCQTINNFDDKFEWKIEGEKNDNELEKKYRVCCFSKSKSIQSFWSLYANEYKGICIEIDLQKIKELDLRTKAFFICMLPCLYVPSKAVANCFFIKYQEIKKVIYKDDSWEWQDEIRLITTITNPSDGKLKINFSKVVKIIIGYNVPLKIKKQIINLCRRKNIQYEVQDIVYNQLIYKKTL